MNSIFKYICFLIIILGFSINAKSAMVTETDNFVYVGNVAISNLTIPVISPNWFYSGGVSGNVPRLTSTSTWEWVDIGISASTATGISQAVVGTLTNGAASGTNLSGSVFIDGLIRTVGTAFTLEGSNAVRGVNMTNGTSGWFDGVVNGSNAVGFSRGGTNYWITIP